MKTPACWNERSLEWLLHYKNISRVFFCFWQDLLAWTRDKSEVEIVDLILKLREKLVGSFLSLCYSMNKTHDIGELASWSTDWATEPKKVSLCTSHPGKSSKAPASSQRRTTGEIRAVHSDHHQLPARRFTDSITQTITVRTTWTLTYTKALCATTLILQNTSYQWTPDTCTGINQQPFYQ